MIQQIVDVLDTWFNSRLEAIHTAVPGMIQSYDPITRLATVKPLVRLQMAKGASVSIPPVNNVPVIFPSSGDCLIHFPLRQGDGCLIIFSEAGIGNYINSQKGTEVDADDESRFSLTDAVAVPGLWPSPAVPFPQDIPGDALLLRYKSVDLQINEDSVTIIASGGLTFSGDLSVSGSISASGEVSANAGTPASVSLSTHIHPTPVGPTSPPTPGT